MIPENAPTLVESRFLRARNVLHLSADLSPLFIDHYLHLRDLSLQPPAKLDSFFKDLLASLTLHLTARPWAETHAWTVNLRAPRSNLFVTGSSTSGSVVGRIFTEDIREPDRNFLHTQVTTPEQASRRSTIELSSTEPLTWLEAYYAQSEQRPARLFHLGEDHYALFAAQPDFDETWLDQLTTEEAREVAKNEPHRLLETRPYHFRCGCDLQKILPVLTPWKDRQDELFGDDQTIQIQCPRCARSYPLTRQDLA